MLVNAQNFGRMFRPALFDVLENVRHEINLFLAQNANRLSYRIIHFCTKNKKSGKPLDTPAPSVPAKTAATISHERGIFKRNVSAVAKIKSTTVEIVISRPNDALTRFAKSSATNRRRLKPFSRNHGT